MISKNRRLKVSKGMMLASRVICPDNSDHVERDKTFWPDGWLLRLDFRCFFRVRSSKGTRAHSGWLSSLSVSCSMSLFLPVEAELVLCNLYSRCSIPLEDKWRRIASISRIYINNQSKRPWQLMTLVMFPSKTLNRWCSNYSSGATFIWSKNYARFSKLCKKLCKHNL